MRTAISPSGPPEKSPCSTGRIRGTAAGCRRETRPLAGIVSHTPIGTFIDLESPPGSGGDEGNPSKFKALPGLRQQPGRHDRRPGQRLPDGHRARRRRGLHCAPGVPADLGRDLNRAGPEPDLLPVRLQPAHQQAVPGPCGPTRRRDHAYFSSPSD